MFNNNTLIEPTDLIIKMWIEYYPYLMIIISALFLLFSCEIFLNLRYSFRKLFQSDALDFALFLYEKYLDHRRWMQSKKNRGYDDAWWRVFNRYNRKYKLVELNQIKTEIIENRFDYLEYCKERKYKMIDFKHDCEAMIEIDNLNQGLLHSIVCYYDQWCQYIPSLAASSELLALFRQNFLRIKNANPNWEEICTKTEALNKSLQQLEEDKYLEIKLVLLRAQLELFEFVWENTESDHYLGSDDYRNDFKFRVQHPTLGLQIMIVSHLQCVLCPCPDEQRVKKVYIVGKEKSGQKCHKTCEHEKSASTSASSTKPKKGARTSNNSGQRKPFQNSQKTKKPT